MKTRSKGSLGKFASSLGSDRASRMISHIAVAKAVSACVTENKFSLN